VPEREAADLIALPAPASGRAQLSKALPVVGPLAGFGLLLVVLGTSAFARRSLWPPVAEPLQTHRFDVAAVGIGAIALALLWLNITVMF
jgi:hypothetical protein